MPSFSTCLYIRSLTLWAAYVNPHDRPHFMGARRKHGVVHRVCFPPLVELPVLDIASIEIGGTIREHFEFELLDLGYSRDVVYKRMPWILSSRSCFAKEEA